MKLSGHKVSQFIVHLDAFCMQIASVSLQLFVCLYNVYPKTTFLVSGPNFRTGSVGREEIRLIVTRVLFTKERERESSKERGS